MFTPDEVAVESTCRPDLPDAKHIQRLIHERKLHIKKVPRTELLKFKEEWGLGAGESAALLLAQAERTVMVTDDYQGMQVARSLGVRFTTTPMIIVAFSRGRAITQELAHAKLDALKQYGWFKPGLIDAAKGLLKED